MAMTRPIHLVTNTELYDRWAKVCALISKFMPFPPIISRRFHNHSALTYIQVYDTDGNILQSIDDSLFPGLLSRVLSLLESSSPITITELGCGTGRNTIKLLDVSASKEKGFGVNIKDINALDLSACMLSRAKMRWESVLVSAHNPRPQPIKFLEFDALDPSSSVSQTLSGQADLVISTLVLEHLPLDTFFRSVRSFLKPSGGYLVLTNMHADMGRRSRAGFLDEETGQKVQGSSFVYEIEDVLNEGRKVGFVLQDKVKERSVRSEDVSDEEGGALLGRRGRKWIGCNVWFGCIMRFEG
jgi:SAM-dependent methyltransferase